MIEDNPLDALLVRKALSDGIEGNSLEPKFNLKLANCLADGIKLLGQGGIDVVLLDLSLPDSRGLETVVKTHNQAPDVPLIILTADDNEETGSRLIREGAQDYLIKNQADRRLLKRTIRYAIERQRAKDARRQLQLSLVTLQEEERHRLARQLHDQVSQSLSALMLGLKSFENRVKSEPTMIALLQKLQRLSSQLAQEVSTLARDLRPVALDDLGLHAALSNYVDDWSERSGVTANLRGVAQGRLPRHIETTVYRIVQEGLTNVLKHAYARQVSVIVECRDDIALLIIEDDGCGFDSDTIAATPVRERKLGLLGMQERAALVGGTLHIESILTRGTTLYVRIPVTKCGQEDSSTWTNYESS